MSGGPSPGGGAAPVEPGGLISLRSWSAPVGVEPRDAWPSTLPALTPIQREGSAAASVRGHLGPHLFSLFENLAVRDRSRLGSSPSEFSHAEESRVIELGSRPMSWAICSRGTARSTGEVHHLGDHVEVRGERGHGPSMNMKSFMNNMSSLGTPQAVADECLGDPAHLRDHLVGVRRARVDPGRSTGISSMKTSRSVRGDGSESCSLEHPRWLPAMADINMFKKMSRLRLVSRPVMRSRGAPLARRGAPSGFPRAGRRERRHRSSPPRHRDEARADHRSGVDAGGPHARDVVRRRSHRDAP